MPRSVSQSHTENHAKYRNSNTYGQTPRSQRKRKENVGPTEDLVTKTTRVKY
jgi:hypothetical protein